jgi:hypothetical protein
MESILLVFARAGLTKRLSLFLLINRVKGLKLYNTVFGNSYENIL